MSAIQFETVMENNIIRIPEQYRAIVRQGKVQVTIQDEYASANKNAQAWQKFLRGLEACGNNEPIELDRVNFDHRVTL